MPDFKLVEIWEHEWKGKLDEVVDEIIPREALSGGHTMAFNLYNKCIDEEKIKYIDYTRPYPNRKSPQRSPGAIIEFHRQ